MAKKSGAVLALSYLPQQRLRLWQWQAGKQGQTQNFGVQESPEGALYTLQKTDPTEEGLPARRTARLLG